MTPTEMLATARELVDTHRGRRANFIEARRIAREVKHEEEQALAWLLGTNTRNRPDFKALGFPEETASDLQTLRRKKREDPEGHMERIRASGRAAVMRVAAVRFRLQSEKEKDERRQHKLIRLGRRLEIELATRRPLTTTEKLDEIQGDVNRALEGIKELANAGYPIVLRLENAGIQKVIQLLETTTRLTGLLAIDLTCADPTSDFDDISALYSTDENFTERIGGALQMAARRLKALKGASETEPGATATEEAK